MLVFRLSLPVCLSFACCLLAGCDSARESSETASPNDYLVSPEVRASLAKPPQGASNSAPADWPALFGPSRTSMTDARLSPIWPEKGPQLVWETEVGTGYGSPVTAEGKVIFNHRVADEDVVQCHRVEDGEQLWEYRQTTTAVCDFEYSDGPYATPVVDVTHGRIYHFGSDGRFSCLNLDSGDVIWSRQLHEEYSVEPDIFPVGASPYLDRGDASPFGQLIFSFGGWKTCGGVLSLDAESGEMRWTATDHEVSYATPIIAELHGQRFALVLTGTGLVSLDPDSGEVDWEYPFRRRGDLCRNATSPMVVGNSVLVVASGPGAALLEIKPDRSFEERWRKRRSLDSQYNTLIYSHDHIFSFGSGGQGGADFCCLDPEDGEIRWQFNSDLKRGMGLANEKAMFLLGEQGHLASMQLTTDEPRVISFTAEPLMESPCYCSPAVYDRYLILKDERRVAVFDTAP